MSLIEKTLAPEESPRMVLGWEEWAALPDLGIYAIKAKIDTGAKTSSLHAFSVESFGPASRRMVRFGIHPISDNPDIEVYCTAPLVDQREVVSSNGEKELRYIIRSMIRVGDRMWPIDISLTNRETMTYRMLIGRQAISDAMIVDPSQSFVQGILSADAYGDVRRRGVRPRHLRIAILTREPENYTNRRLVEEAEKRGHGVDVVNTVRCYMNINADQPEVHYQGEVLPRYDAVIPRVGASITFYGMAVVRQFEMMGTYVLNTAEAIGRSRDKLYAHQLLASNGISMPITGFASSTRDSASLIKFVGGPPVVLKLLEGTQGRGVMLAESKASAEAQIQAFRGLRANILVQQFIGEAAGTDLRLIVIGGRVVAAMRREASQGDWRANLHRGGKAIGIRISSEEREVAVQAARVMGLKVAGVDLLRAKDGPKVLEVNSSPGLEGIEKVSRKNIAGLIIEHIERRAVVRGRHPIAV